MIDRRGAVDVEFTDLGRPVRARRGRARAGDAVRLAPSLRAPAAVALVAYAVMVATMAVTAGSAALLGDAGTHAIIALTSAALGALAWSPE